MECNRYNYCADAVKGIEGACRAVSYSQADNQPASGNQAAESNRSNEWTGNPDIDNAIIMLDRIDTAESCDDDRIEAVKAVLRRLAGNYPVTPDGWVIVPKKLTAENGAKGVLSGEFSETTFISCPECFGDDDCDTCDGSGRIEIKVPVTWTTIKSIWDKGIAHLQQNRRRRLTVANLQLAVKGEYFDAMIRGEKTEEYRLCNDYWNKRIMFREYDRLIITKGYPKRDDSSRRIDVPYDGYEIKTITHPHFGDKPVKVFAIKVNISNE